MESQIDFENDHGERLVGTVHEPETADDRGVILGHCFTCSRHTRILKRIAYHLVEAGISALRFDFSGNGGSEGTFERSTYSRQIGEIKTAAQWFADRGISRLGLAGHSMGAAIAVLAGAEMDSVRAVCALAGRTSGLGAMGFLSAAQKEELDRTGRVTFQSRGRALALTDEFFADAGRYDIEAAIRDYPKPLMIVHGDADAVISIDEAHAAKRSNPAGVELAVIAEADHMFSQQAHQDQVSGRVVDWFQKLL